jgi:integrase
VFTNPNGIKQAARTTFQTKAEAEFEVTRIYAAVRSGTWQADETPQAGNLDPKTLTLKELATHWRGQQVSSKGNPLSPTTLREYQRLIESTLKVFAEKPIRSITRQQVENWRAPEIKRAPNQTVKAYKHLKTLMTWAQKRSWIAVNPCEIERGSAYTPSEPIAPDKQQIQIMLDSATDQFKIILALAAFGGLRKGEILELRRKDLEISDDSGERWVRVSVARGVVWDGNLAIARKPKSDAGVRSLLLPLGVSDLIIGHLRTRLPRKL